MCASFSYNHFHKTVHCKMHLHCKMHCNTLSGPFSMIIYLFFLNELELDFPPDRITHQFRDDNFVCLITLKTTIKVNPLRDIYIFSILK